MGGILESVSPTLLGKSVGICLPVRQTMNFSKWRIPLGWQPARLLDTFSRNPRCTTSLCLISRYVKSFETGVTVSKNHGGLMRYDTPASAALAKGGDHVNQKTNHIPAFVRDYLAHQTPTARKATETFETSPDPSFLYRRIRVECNIYMQRENSWHRKFSFL